MIIADYPTAFYTFSFGELTCADIKKKASTPDLEVGQKATSEQRSILDPEEVLHYLRTQKMVLLLEDENGRIRIPYPSLTGTTHEDRKTRKVRGEAAPYDPDFKEYFLKQERERMRNEKKDGR